MKALTLIQPWATAILSLGKDIENRPWAPPKWLIGKRFAIHAGKTVDKRDEWGLAEHLGQLALDELPVGCILGTVRLRGYVVTDGQKGALGLDFALGLTHDEIETALESKWRAPESRCLWVVSEPLLLATPVACRGALGLWEIPAGLLPADELAKGSP